jgi:hypothetical protein
MSRDFVGRGYVEPTRYGVYVEEGGMRSDMTHKVRGSTTDYQWDGGGPESAELARAMLWVVSGVEPEWRVYRLFRTEVVSAWPRRSGECWRISEEQIRQWLAGLERDTAKAESAEQTKARLDQTRGRESRIKGFAAMFPGVSD